MNYQEALAYIHSANKFGSKKGLENIRALLAKLDNPQNKLKFIHIAGTNGKGSTSSFIHHVLLEAGYKTGLFTSPFLERFNERIRINNLEISDDSLGAYTDLVRKKIEELKKEGLPCPTEFEMITAIGLQYFFDNQCDIVVLEAGLGGRLDSTNIIPSAEVSVITSISYDHMKILGHTLEEIAFEKAGILKRSGQLVLYPQKDSVRDVIERIAAHQSNTVHHVDPLKITYGQTTSLQQRFDYEPYKGLEIGLLGKFQVMNAATAVSAVNLLLQKGYRISEEHLRSGLRNTRWPGRMEVILQQPMMLIDGAHNAEGANMLAHSLKEMFEEYKRIFILGLLRDKEVDPIFEAIGSVADVILTVQPSSDRAMDYTLLAEKIHQKFPHLKVEPIGKVEQCIEKSLEISQNFALQGEKPVICVCGSLYYIGSVRKYIRLKYS